MIEDFLGMKPTIDPSAWVHPHAVVIGKVTLKGRVSIWPGVILRGDMETIEIGEESNIQDLTLAHTSQGGSPVRIGRRVVVGHRVILHGTVVEDGALVGMGSILLDGSHLGEGAILAAGSVLTEGSRIPAGQLAMGTPAKVIRQVTEAEKQRIAEGAQNYLELMAMYKKR
jgi:carbonic anhydrase/acetyltransferase-like protein (isoleucine patch superfamily)